MTTVPRDARKVLWQAYLERLEAAGLDADTARAPGTAAPGAPSTMSGCGHKH